MVKKTYFEPELKIVDYEALENVSLDIGGTLESWGDGNGEDFAW